MDERKKILILGVTGMLGNALYRHLHFLQNLDVHGIARNKDIKQFFTSNEQKNIHYLEDVLDFQKLEKFLGVIKPDYIINCVGIIKQKEIDINNFAYISINSLLPQVISNYCKHNNVRFIHFSTDCVFDGTTGNYYDNDPHTAKDFYGRTKSLGEVGGTRTLTLRTSIIGHEVNTRAGLIDWFLSTDEAVSGFTDAYFSGLPTIYIGQLVRHLITGGYDLEGIYNVSSKKISKYHLLNLVKAVYNLDVDIRPVKEPVIDRTLNSEEFQELFEWKCPSWDCLVQTMYEDYKDVVNRRQRI
jgi:dTDP-4-dehydrorhamnose reductase